MKIKRKKVWIVLWDDAREQYVIANAIGMVFQTQDKFYNHDPKRCDLNTYLRSDYPLVVFRNTFPILNDWVFPLSRFSESRDEAIKKHVRMLVNVVKDQTQRIQNSMADIEKFMDLYAEAGIEIMDVYCGNERRY